MESIQSDQSGSASSWHFANLRDKFMPPWLTAICGAILLVGLSWSLFGNLITGSATTSLETESLIADVADATVDDRAEEDALAAAAEAKAEQDRIVAEQQSAELAAIQQQWAASLAEAKAENSLAIDSINAMWRAVPSDARARMLDVQKAWVARKDAACRVEAASGATSEEEIQLARLRCDTREQISRTNELKQYAMRSIEGSYAAEEM